MFSKGLEALSSTAQDLERPLELNMGGDGRAMCHSASWQLSDQTDEMTLFDPDLAERCVNCFRLGPGDRRIQMDTLQCAGLRRYAKKQTPT